MKILHVITSLNAGGSEKLMVDLIPRFNAKNIECELLTFNGAMTPFRKALEKQGVKIHDFGENNGVYTIRNIVRLIPFLRKFDIVHTHNFASQLFAAIGSLACPVALYTTEHTTSNRRRGWKWYAPVEHWMYSRYKKIICISQMTYDSLRHHVPNVESKMTVIHNGIPVQQFSNANPSQALCLKKDIVKITMVAGFRSQKDHPTVIKALIHLPESYHLFLIGDGSRRDEYRNLVANLGLENRVHFMGVRSDVPEILKASNISIMSSHWEGFGLAAAEGMASGIPVVASDIPGLREVIGTAGLFFTPGDSNDLSKKIIALMGDNELQAELSQAGMERAKQFSIDKMVEGYSKLYEEIK